jgi:DNA-binding PadR family transcriptional regulator
MTLGKREFDLVILGILMASPAPLHGYLIKQSIEGSYGGRYFKLSNSSMYPRLAKLESDGYIEGRKEQQENVPDKKVYSITEAGKRRFKELLTTPVDPHASTSDRDYNFMVHAVHFSYINKEERAKVTRPMYEDAQAELDEALGKREKFGQYLDKISLLVLDEGIEQLRNKVRFYGRLIELE